MRHLLERGRKNRYLISAVRTNRTCSKRFHFSSSLYVVYEVYLATFLEEDWIEIKQDVVDKVAEFRDMYGDS